MGRKVRHRARQPPATFSLNFHARGDARLVEIFDTVRAVLADYQQCCREFGEPYPFSFELFAHNQRHAGLYEAIILDIFRYANQQFYPFTIDWYAVQHQAKQNRYLLTFALRDIDLRELAGMTP